MLEKFLLDALYAAIAAIGFSAISNPPRLAYLFCAIIAATGHSIRFLLMDTGIVGMSIIPATAIASFIIGALAVFLSPLARIPAETFMFPSLLPMIPGIYMYRTFGGLAMYLFRNGDDGQAVHYLNIFLNNGFTCMFIILGMVIGGTLPIFLLKHIAYRATR